jgi:hypothetical protein
MANSDPRLLLLNAADNVLVARQPLPVQESVLVEGRAVRLEAPLRLGHKLARRAIASGEAVVKYGFPIGYATADIQPGESVHLHNVRSGYTASVSLDAELAGSDGPGPYDAGARNG